MDFTNRNLGVLFTWGDTTVYLTETFLATWIIMGVLFLLTIYTNIRLRKFKGVPTGFQNVIEFLVETMQAFVLDTIGVEMVHLGGYFFGAFVFILMSNYSGLLGFRPPTADLATTGALALITFFFCHYYGITRRKGKYFKSYIEPMAPFLPLNIIGAVSRPVSLAFRLFGNILSGIIIMGLIYNMAPVLLRFILPDVLHLYFDILVGAIQTYVFTVLSMTFIREIATGD